MGRSGSYLAVVKVVGVGGGGTNAVSRMVDVGLRGVEFIAANTDAQALAMCDADVKLNIGHESTKGLGVGRDRKSTRLNSSHQIISYAVFCLKKKKKLSHRNYGMT